MRTHPATVVQHGELVAEIDLDLAPLVVEIWRAGIGTIHSCQDVGENLAELATRLPHVAEIARRERGRASIGFAGVEPLLGFLDALANAGPRDELYERLAHWASPDAWQVVLGLQDLGLTRDDDGDEAPGEGGMAPDGVPHSRLSAGSFQVRFPRSDLGEMTERMRRHNRGEAVALGRPTWAAITVPEPEPEPATAADSDAGPSGPGATSEKA